MADDLLSRTPPLPDHRVHYRGGPEQFGDLWMPKLKDGARAPVAVFVHGGWWKAQYGLAYGGHLCAALKSAGIAVWSLEYRRVGQAGGGWPGTFVDVNDGYEYLPTLVRSYPLDLQRVVVIGHSAGGHLAFWLAGRDHLPFTGELRRPTGKLTPMRGLVALAGAVDLRWTIELAGSRVFAHDRQEVLNLMGGAPEQVPERYRAADPGQLLPLNVPQVLIQGMQDDQIPWGLPARWLERGQRIGETVTVEMISGADHFDVVDPESKAWPQVLAAVQRLLG